MKASGWRWHRNGAVAIVFLCVLVLHGVSRHFAPPGGRAAAPPAPAAFAVPRPATATAALDARVAAINAGRGAPGYRGRYGSAEAWWGGQTERERVVVLSPVRATNARRQARFARLLLALEWPREDLGVALLVSPDSSAICDAENVALGAAVPPFAFVRAIPEPAGLASLNAGDQSERSRHAPAGQLERRSAIARARNHLAMAAIADSKADWVLWLDNDLLAYPPSLIADLRASDVDVVVPTCYCSGNDACGGGVYDKNSYKETAASTAALRALDAAGEPDKLVVNGYGEIDGSRLFLDDLKKHDDAPLVELDGVGATCILLRADLHREGLTFPPFTLDHAVESEGLARAALRLGAGVYGRTDVAIRHA